MTSKRAALALAVCLLTLISTAGSASAANDPLFGQQWGLHRIQAEPAWTPAASGSGVVVAVVDTGVNFGHEDLAGKSAGELNAIAPRKDRGPCEADSGDNNGHGTLVAGIIAGNSNNDRGVASVAPEARIMSVKVLDCWGYGYLSDVSNGIRMAARNGARVINLSLGYEIGFLGELIGGLLGQDERRDFQAAINEAAGHGALIVAAAGNDALESSYAGMENVLVVGASGPADEHSSYSSSGAEIMAPGGNASGNCDGKLDRCIATTHRGGGYAAVEGTSFAAPHVSGVAALLFRQGHSAAGARSVISSTADGVPAGPRVNAARAVGAPVPAGTQSPGGGAEEAAAGGAELPGASGPATPSRTSAAGKGVPPGQAASPGQAPTATPPSGPPAGTLVLGASQGAPPEVSREVAGGAGGAGAAGRAPRSSAGEGAAKGSGARNALIGITFLAAAGGGYLFWKKRLLT